MSEPEAQKRRIRFLEPDGMRWLERYAEDFQGRAIQYERVSDNEVVLPINDAMEFLYTYTWGKRHTSMKFRSSSVYSRQQPMRTVFEKRWVNKPTLLRYDISFRGLHGGTR